MQSVQTFDFQRARTEFDGFETLFGRFLHETGSSADWDKLKLLPDDAVSISHEWFCVDLVTSVVKPLS